MDARDKIKLRGRLQIYNTDTGELLRDVENLVVNTGLAFLASALSGGVPTLMGWNGVGSGATAPATGDTDLEAVIGARMASTVTAPTASSVRFAATSAAGSHTGNWYEAGIFNALAAGTMLCRVTFGLLTKASGDSFTVQHTVSFADDGV